MEWNTAAKVVFFFAYMQIKSADCSKNCTFLVESRKDVQSDNVQSTKGKTIVKSRMKGGRRTGRRKEGESGESHSPEKEERREFGLNPDEMNITLRGGNGLWMRMFIDH